MSNLTPAIKAKNLTKRFGDFTAVDNIEFEVMPGEIFGFLGPNGSGKTTTIRMTLGLLQPTAGEIEVLGTSMNGGSAQVRHRVGYMSQKFSLYNDLSVAQNLRFYGTAYGLSNTILQKRIDDALQMAGLQGRSNVKTKDLSGGWRQRLALSAAMLHRPEVLFLDEPTAGVDPVSRRAFWDLLYRQVERGVTVFVTTHYMDEAEHCQRLAFIQRGQIIAYGTPQAIKRETLAGQILEIAPKDAAAVIRFLRATQKDGRIPLTEVELYGALVHVIIPQAEKWVNPIRRELRQAGIDPGNIAVIDPSLEDVFITRMKMAPHA